MFDMMKQAQAMQSKMKAFQDEMEQKEFTGTAGGGAVTVTVNGKHVVLKVILTPEAAGSGPEMLQDLVKAAVNAAIDQAAEHLKVEMGRITGGMLPPGLF